MSARKREWRKLRVSIRRRCLACVKAGRSGCETNKRITKMSRSDKVPDGGQMGLQRGNVPSVGWCSECAHQGACPERAGQ